MRASTLLLFITFYHNEKQKELAEKYKAALDKSGAWENPIVTEIVPATEFYEAEKYHQDYYTNNPNQGYCALLIAPKVEKFKKVFKDKLKKYYSIETPIDISFPLNKNLALSQLGGPNHALTLFEYP